MPSNQTNTPGLGIDYEVLTPAYFALVLNSKPEIEDFRLQSNAQGFGNLDDLLVDIKTKSGEELHFAFQLKHSENSRKNLLPTSFEAKGNFNLEKYCEAFKKLNQKNREYHFILYTNREFDYSRVKEVKKFTMSQAEGCLGRNLFDTSDSSINLKLYKFEVNAETEDGQNVKKEDYVQFFARFSVYTGQANTRNLAKSRILEILKFDERYVKYSHFFRRWHSGDFIDKILDKKTLNLHLIDIFLSSITIDRHFSNGQDENLMFFETLVQQFDITVIDDSKKKFMEQLEENMLLTTYMEKIKINSGNVEECLIRLGKEYKIIDRFTQVLMEETKLKLLYYLFKKPLILDFNSSSQNFVYDAIELCKFQENEIKLVLVGRNIDVRKFQDFRVFTSLKEVRARSFLEGTIRRCKLFLQQRDISFDKIVTDEICEFVSPKEIFQMMKGSFSIGEGKEDLPECYIPRTVLATVFNVERIIEHCPCAVLIFNCENEFKKNETIFEKKHVKVVKLEEYLREPLKFQKFLTVILRQEECSRRQFDGIRKKAGETDVHVFKILNEGSCLLIMSTRNVFHNEEYKSIKMSVEEDKIHNFFNNPINILCAQPGMGKSTLMKYLKNECDPNFWTLWIDLKAYNYFLNQNRKVDDILNIFLELENEKNVFLRRLKKMFMEERKIFIFLDGLDEIEYHHVDYVMNLTNELSKMGFRIWLSSRQNLQQKLETAFNVFPLEIGELNKNQQKKYIERRLRTFYEKKEIEEVTEKIFNNTNLANNSQVLEIPLQLQIITQIFMDDRSHYRNLNKNNFILTKMFEIFFEGKYKHYIAKIESKHPHLLGKLEEQLENYEVLALHSVLDNAHFKELQIETKMEHLKQIKKNGDRLGIVTNVNSENKAVFQHLTFAEYFASKFFVKNFDKARILKKQFFSKKYQNLFLIFNIMLAESSPLHLAIIYRNVEEIRNVETLSVVDKGGRNGLQIAACLCTRYPDLLTGRVSQSVQTVRRKTFFPDFIPFFKHMTILVRRITVFDRFHRIKEFKGENSKIKEIIDNFSSIDPFKNDTLFEWNSLDYAFASGSLYLVEAILEKFGRPVNFYEILKKYYKDEIVAYYAVRFGYHCLLSEILANKKTWFVINIMTEILRDSIIGFSMLADCANRTRIVELLIGDDINEIVCSRSGFTFLHFSVYYNDIKVTTFLLEKGANVNIKDIEGRSSLVLAVLQRNVEISRLLLDRGADVNSKTIKGKSPLFEAMSILNFELIELFLNRGADVNTKSELGETLLEVAAGKGNFALVQLLIDKGANWDKTIIFPAIFGDNIQIIKFFVNKGLDLSKVRGLHYAIRTDRINVFNYLIEHDADVDLLDSSGNTILHEASMKDNVEIFGTILTNPKTAHLVYVPNKKGATVLHIAVYCGATAIVELVLTKEIDFTKIDVNNTEYPLYFAARYGCLKKELLLKMTRFCKELLKRNLGLYENPVNVVSYLFYKMRHSL